MSSHSPSRLRAKTSDIADFFRTSTSSVSRQLQNDPQTLTPSLLGIPQTSESPTKMKKTTKIPFLGRTRKKSTQSTKSSGPMASTSSTPGRGYDSSEITDSKATSLKKDRLSHPISSSSDAAAVHPPVPTVVHPANTSSPSIGLKFAAHFAPAKSRKTPSPRFSRAVYSDGETSDTLLAPSNTRAASFDSRFSSASESRSATPRPAKPTITVSLSPDNFDDYQDLFTLPRKKRQPPVTPASEYRDKYHEGSSNVTLSPTNVNPRTESLSEQASGDVSQTDAEQETSQSPPGDRPPSSSSKNSIGRSSRSSVTALGADEIAEEPASAVNNSQASPLAPAIDIRAASPLTRKLSSPIPRSARLRTTTAAERPSRPPSIPLPPPPNANPPILRTTSAQTVFSTRTPATLPLRRPRAHTVSVIPPAPRVSPPSPPSSPGIPRRTKSPVDTGAAVRQSSDKKNINPNTASMEELKQALESRTQQYEDLASHLLKVTATHVAEKNSLEKKISALEKDLARKDKEIKGLTWLLVNNRISLSGADVESALNSAQLAYRPSPDSTVRVPSRLRGNEESGVESHQTSGAESVSESVRGSGASGTESHSALPVKKARRPMLGHLYRSSTKLTRGLGVGSIASDSSVRSSVYSLSSSATSSTSSLSQPSPSSTGSLLSAIPEGPNQLPPSRPAKAMRERASLSAGEGEKDEQRTTTRTNRISTSSLASSSSSSAATSAYSANLKRGRPPSIAQVLEKSTAVEDVLQKLRPFKSAAIAP